MSPLRWDKFIGKNASGWGDFDRRVGVDVDIVETWAGLVEEFFPEGDEVEVGVGEEEEGNFGAEGGGGAKSGFGGGEVGFDGVGGGRGEGDGFVEKGQVVELVRGGDGETARREEGWGYEVEKHREAEQKCEGWDERR